ncbi:uncharacterized protein ACA1_278590 [Acanthamoeba castellanii str. Neff]|uniref:Uncharacterized protein n=1 Tax=Acanthamoeba castellanii (strain ATCC 30010 / Neff) TaxID=1257118 RepID=L8H832_ACACF|nr:uncharacterized protein ACA1_278590 [Acanthamoeba castellanii str. Neff]ELR20898.1 hypothetical protein ACA1_278590 [Acanthamoeba castellanii str. Neff]
MFVALPRRPNAPRTLTLRLAPVSSTRTRASPHLLFAYHKTSIDRHIDVLVTSCLAVQERLMTSVSLDERNRCVLTHKVFGGCATDAAATNQPKTRKRQRTEAPIS